MPAASPSDNQMCLQTLLDVCLGAKFPSVEGPWSLLWVLKQTLASVLPSLSLYLPPSCCLGSLLGSLLDHRSWAQGGKWEGGNDCLPRLRSGHKANTRQAGMIPVPGEETYLGDSACRKPHGTGWD